MERAQTAAVSNGRLVTYQSALAGAIAALVLSSPFAATAAMAATETAAEVCAACHGANGISVKDSFPNLAGQKQKYLAAQLQAFKSGTRKNLIMNAVAEQLNDDDIAELAGFFAGLAGAASGAANSKPLAHMLGTRVSFPADYAESHTYYTTINFPKKNQVRKYYANAAAIGSAGGGRSLPNGSHFLVEVFKAKLDADKKPIMGSDGFFVADKLIVYTAMEKQSGWGKDFPEILQNGDWNYAVFKADKTRIGSINQATCLACHKPLAKDSYVFSLQQLKEVASK